MFVLATLKKPLQSSRGQQYLSHLTQRGFDPRPCLQSKRDVLGLARTRLVAPLQASHRARKTSQHAFAPNFLQRETGGGSGGNIRSRGEDHRRVQRGNLSLQRFRNRSTQDAAAASQIRLVFKTASASKETIRVSESNRVVLLLCIWGTIQGPAWNGAWKPGWSSITITLITSHPLRSSISLSPRSPSTVRGRRTRRRAAAGWSRSTR